MKSTLACLAAGAFCAPVSSAWIHQNHQNSNLFSSRCASAFQRRPPTVALHAVLPDGYQEMGEFLIRKAGQECGVTSDDQLEISWNADRIVVTVRGDSFVSDPMLDAGDLDGDLEDDFEDDFDDDDDIDDNSFTDELEDEDDTYDEDIDQPTGINVAKLARAINAKLNDGGVGLAIAETHSIEVTTPGASDEIVGDVMFQAYKGFDVTVEFKDPKTKKEKKIDGRLMERNDEITVINIKGRMKNLKNEDVIKVVLPKPKKEKGAR